MHVILSTSHLIGPRASSQASVFISSSASLVSRNSSEGQLYLYNVATR